MSFKQKTAILIFKWMGWRFVGDPNALQLWDDTQKCVLIVAPHTASSDYYIGYLALAALGKKAKFLIKRKFFTFPFGWLLKVNGGIPVDQGKKNKDFVEQVTDAFQKSSRMFLTIAPEGTRKKTTRWRKGFYQIAEETGVPLLLGALDYKKKHVILGDKLQITHDFNADMQQVNAFYEHVSGKRPEQFAFHKTN